MTPLEAVIAWVLTGLVIEVALPLFGAERDVSRYICGCTTFATAMLLVWSGVIVAPHSIGIAIVTP